MNCFRFLPLVVIGSGLACATLPAAAQDDAQPTPPPATKSFDAAAIDKTADPCQDFYEYACGNWKKNNPIPGDQVRWSRSFSLLQERNRYLLWQELNTAAQDPKTPLEKKYGDFYAACMNTGLLEKKGLAPIEPALQRIAAVKDAKNLGPMIGDLAAQGEPAPLFRFGVQQDEKDSSKQIAGISQAGLSLPDRDYYLLDRFAAIRKQYVEHMTKMFTLAGDAPEQAGKEADAVLAIETALAKASTSRTELRDPEKRYHIYTLADLQKLAPDFDFSAYFKDVKVGHFETLNVATPDFFKALNELIASQTLDAWKSYFRWHVLTNSADDLPKAFRDEDFSFFGKVLAGQKEPTPRWRQCTAVTDQSMGEAVGQEWVKEHFPPQAKASMDKLVAALDKSLGDDIKTLPWMSEDTKKAAEEKLAQFRNKIGYPEKWRDYSALTVDRDDLIGNTQRATAFQRSYNLNKLGKPVDEKEWGMTPPTVNAYYSPSNNDINFPAGILQPPFYDFSKDPGVNFGAIGVVIGHEMTHGFDTSGSQFDGHGAQVDWWSPDVKKTFDGKASCLKNQYSQYQALPGLNVNGSLTITENIADQGGVKLSYAAYKLAREGLPPEAP
ncbi:MAG TPA: M13 family metallopeptidase, partial [Terracidiphilus sp.]